MSRSTAHESYLTGADRCFLVVSSIQEFPPGLRIFIPPEFVRVGRCVITKRVCGHLCDGHFCSNYSPSGTGLTQELRLLMLLAFHQLVCFHYSSHISTLSLRRGRQALLASSSTGINLCLLIFPLFKVRGREMQNTKTKRVRWRCQNKPQKVMKTIFRLSLRPRSFHWKIKVLLCSNCQPMAGW